MFDHPIRSFDDRPMRKVPAALERRYRNERAGADKPGSHVTLVLSDPDHPEEAPMMQPGGRNDAKLLALLVLGTVLLGMIAVGA